MKEPAEAGSVHKPSTPCAGEPHVHAFRRFTRALVPGLIVLGHRALEAVDGGPCLPRANLGSLIGSPRGSAITRAPGRAIGGTKRPTLLGAEAHRTDTITTADAGCS